MRPLEQLEAADPDDIDPKRYLDGISSHELLDTSTPGGSSRSTCCTCGKWCFSGLVRDEAERLDFENNLRTEWERHRAFATERVEPVSREYMLRVGEPYRWNESADPDDFDPQRYVDAVSQSRIQLHAAGFRQVSNDRWVRDRQNGTTVEITKMGASGWMLTYRGHAWSSSTQYMTLHGAIYASKELRESADPDDIDPQRYLAAIKPRHGYVIMWYSPSWGKTNYYVTGPENGGGKWIEGTRYATHWTEKKYAVAYKKKWLDKWHPGEIHVEPLSVLSESSDPDDINFDSYVLNAWEELLRSKGFKYQDKGNPYWWKVRGKMVTAIRQAEADEPGTLEVIKYIIVADEDAAKYRWEQREPASRIPVKKLYLVIESSDPDDIDPQRYLSAIRVVWVIKWNDAYYEARSHSHGQFAGGEWKLKPDHATRWVSREAAQSWFDKNLRPWYQNAEVVPVERRLSESADPDDINPEHYLDAVAATAGPLELRARLRAAFRGSFMQPEYYHSAYHEVETREGTYIVPSDVVDSDDPDDYADFVEGRITEVSERREGWVYRTSASGYMDASDWGAAGSEEEAIDALIDNYGDADAGLEDGLEESADPDDPQRYIDGVVPPVQAVFTVDDGEGTSVRVDATDYLNMRPKRWLKNLYIHADLAGTPAVGVDFEYTEPDLAVLSKLRLPDAVFARMRDYECGGVLEIDRDSLERWRTRRQVKESADPDDIDPQKWLHSLKLTQARVREIVRRIPKHFHIGFSIHTSDQSALEADAAEDGIELTDEVWTALLRDIDLIERNVRKWMDEHGIYNRSEGHDGDGDLVGSIFLDLAAPSNFDLFEDYMQHEEPWRTSSGKLPRGMDVYADASEFAHLLGVDIDLFDYADCQAAFEEMQDAGVTVKLLNAVWTGTTPPREVAEAADPDEPNMARWVERLSAEAQLNRIFNEQGMPYFRDDPKGATNWSRWFRWGDFEVWTTFTIFHKGQHAPTGHLSYEFKHGTFQHKNSEFVRGPDNILKMIDLFDHHTLAGLNQNPPKKVSDVIRAFEKPLSWAYSLERYGEDTSATLANR